eukprot:CAMPEP_0177736442 /NCGR_PEP_ID=MMETSP0484_2-20121128/25337_1 /TAXON_ID=354590 /ORGANISM="Rhodomonas lens, Strain RHODO" /LENGTH=733 /DNA_ID=CAMNT_0019250123 /DNA_START=197 /DNA_END=2399 /DNA_ORIENTATION=+
MPRSISISSDLPNAGIRRDFSTGANRTYEAGGAGGWDSTDDLYAQPVIQLHNDPRWPDIVSRAAADGHGARAPTLMGRSGSSLSDAATSSLRHVRSDAVLGHSKIGARAELSGEAGEGLGELSGRVPPGGVMERSMSDISGVNTQNLTRTAQMSLPRERTKYIYIVSDSTGFTASHALTSVMAQFDSLVVDWNGQDAGEGGKAPEVRTQMFSNVKDWGRLDRIAQLAARMDAFIMFTLVNPQLHRRLVRQCEALRIPFQDLQGPSSAAYPTKPLSDKYFKRVEAVEFTIKQDDGALARNLDKADVVLLGVSRSSKTPLSMYLAQQFGYKVANVPLVLNIPPPAEIFKVDPRRVFGLVISPQYLRRIRTRRLAGTGVDTDTIGKNAGSFDYSNIKYINEELRFARELYAQHPEWSVLDVTGRAVEENAAIIAELMPGKPTPVEAALHALDCNFIIIDPKTHPTQFPIVFASDGFLQATGYTREELIGQSPTILHGPETCRDTIAKVWQHLAEGREGHFELVNYRKDGSTFKKELHLSPVRNFEGETAFIFATQCELQPLAPGFNPVAKGEVDEEGDFLRELVDKEKEREMRKEVQRQGWISVTISDATSSTTPLVFASEGFFKMTGYEPAEILGHSLEMLYGQDTDPATVAKISEAVRANEALSTCVLCYRKDGNTFWNHLSLQPVFDMNGELRYYVGTQYTGTSGVGNLVRDCGATFPSGLQTHASVTPFLPA